MFVLSLAGLMLATVLSSCSSDSDPSSLDLPAADRAKWSLPLDSYAMDEESIAERQYAWMLVSVKCFNDAGGVLTVPSYMEPPLSDSPSWNEVGRYLFDPELAALYGYHTAPRGDATALTQWDEFRAVAFSDGQRTTLQSCQQQAWKQIPDLQGQDDIVRDFQGVASERAHESDAVKLAAEAWHSCMAPVGIPDLPAAPWFMPSTSQMAKFGLGDDGGSNTAAASAEEKGDAVRDAECRESSGYANALYTAEWDAQVDILGSQFDTLVRARELFADSRVKVEEVLAQHVVAAG